MAELWKLFRARMSVTFSVKEVLTSGELELTSYEEIRFDWPKSGTKLLLLNKPISATI